jgi:hypothetical protein
MASDFLSRLQKGCIMLKWYGRTPSTKLTMNATEKATLFQSDKVCRLCLSRKRAMLPIFYEDGTSFPMASRILTYIGIEVSFR